MTARRSLREAIAELERLVAALGVESDHDHEQRPYRDRWSGAWQPAAFEIWAPAGRVFAANGAHVVCAQWSRGERKTAALESLIADLEQGLEACAQPDCDVCAEAHERVEACTIQRENGDRDELHLCRACEASTQDFARVLARRPSEAECDRCGWSPPRPALQIPAGKP